MVRGIGRLYMNNQPIGNLTDFNLNINETFGSMGSKYNRSTTLIGNVADFKLFDEVLTQRKLNKKESKMKKSKMKKRINELSKDNATLTQVNSNGQYIINELRSRVEHREEQIHHQQCEINRLNKIADENLENFKKLADNYQKSIDFIGSITDDMKINIDFKS